MEKPWSNDCITFAYTVDQCMIIQKMVNSGNYI